jgi:pimeloyl-ACP methyl ester carboxylesterase
MILLHGTGDTAHVWDHFASSALKHFRIIALDQRGHGDSDRANPPAYGCDDYVGDLAGLIEALQLADVVLMGHSMGALHATRYASMRPDKLAGLVHVDIESCPPTWNREYLRGLYDTLPAFYHSIQDFVGFMQKSSPYARKEMLTYIASYALKERKDGRFYPKIDREVLSHFDQYDLRLYLADVKCPTLIVRGEESRVMRREIAQEMNRAISSSRLVEIPQAAHPVHTDNPQQFHSAVLDFLKDSHLLTE